MTALGDISTTVLLAGPSVNSQVFGSALIGLREGLEASIVVMILVAFLIKSGRRDALKWVWLGVGAAIAMTLGIFLVIQLGENTLTDLAAEAIAGVASLVAVVIVTTMVLWMKKAAAGMSGQLRAEMGAALEAGNFAVLSLAFLAVGREGAETALFMVGYAAEGALLPLAGLIVGVLLAAAIAFGMYRGAVRLNLGTFFKYTGVFLVVVAAGILSYGVGALQTVGWLPALGHRAFDLTSWFDWDNWFMRAVVELVQGIFNITPTPTVLQFAAWLTYLIVVLALFLRPGTRQADTDPAPDPEPSPESERSTQ